MQSQFKVDATTFKYKRGRRGISAVCNILDLEGNVVGVLKDEPECIVANVKFVSETIQNKFLMEAQANLDSESWVRRQFASTPSAASWASEYARQITMAAEAELVK